MKWDKKGLIFAPEGKYDWSRSHAQVPKAYKIDEKIMRIYFGTRDDKYRTRTTFIEVDSENLKEIKYIHDKPVMELGKLGSFDDRGVMPACIFKDTGRILMYYTGWNMDITVSYRLSIGLAESKDGGITFTRISSGPIIDRSIHEPYSVCQPYVIKENGTYRMWYSSFTKWELIKGKTEPFYNIKYAESPDGINWNLTGITCLDYDERTDALGNPYVWKENGVYKILYAFRRNINYRQDKTTSYRIGYAESSDGIHWVKKEDETGIDVSAEGWDSEMIAYPNMCNENGRNILFYNGNGFGRSGFGYAILEK